MRNQGKPIKTQCCGHFDRNVVIHVSHYYNSGAGLFDRCAIALVEGKGSALDSSMFVYLTKKQTLELIENLKKVVNEGSFVGGGEWKE